MTVPSPVADVLLNRWAFTFPLGSLTLLTYSLGTTFDSLFFKSACPLFSRDLATDNPTCRVVGVIMTFCVTLLWTIVFIPTALGFFRGTLFPAPCLASLPPAYVEKLPLGGGKGVEGAPEVVES